MRAPVAASTAAWLFIIGPIVIIWAIGLVDIFKRPLPRGTKAAWVIIVVLLPIIGTVTYFLLRKPTDEEIRRTRAASEGGAAEPRSTGVGPRPPVD